MQHSRVVSNRRKSYQEDSARFSTDRYYSEELAHPQDLRRMTNYQGTCENADVDYLFENLS